jgi:uncharacterized membrane protein
VHYFPIALPFLIFFGFLFILLIFLIEVGILEYAYARLGIGRRHMFALLLLTLLGSYINIPVFSLPAEQVYSGREITFFGMPYVIPYVTKWPRTIVAVNVGGALIPALLSAYLLVKHELYRQGLLAVVVVTVGVHLTARSVPGVGIAEPVFIPPVLAAAGGLLLSRSYAAPLAYIGGSLGTLIGADLMNMHKLQGLGAPIVSIGGAGTFDGIFLAGILSVLLASLLSKKPEKDALPSSPS